MKTEAPGTWTFERSHLLYCWFTAAFAVILVLTNIIGPKLFLFDAGPISAWLNDGEALTLTAGIITYPLTFWLTDVVSEIWGRKRADLMVIFGFLMSLLMLGILSIARALPPSPFWSVPQHGFETGAEMQLAFLGVFSNPGILLFASMFAYLVAQLFDVRLYHFWWRVTKGRHLWIRNNGSTLISQLVDTILVNGIFLRWGYGMEWPAIWSVILAVYVCKAGLAMIDTPLIYLGVRAVEKALGLDPKRDRTYAPLS